MGKYNSVTLDRDRAFDVNSLQELLTQGKSILNKAIDLSKKMEVSISAIASTYSGIEGGYRVGALGADIDSLRGTLVKGIYQDTIDQMEKILTKLMDDMPAYDNSLAQAVDGIGEILGSVRGRIEELRGLLEAGDVNLAYQEFRSRLEEVKTGWDASTAELAEALAEIESDMLGVTAAAVQYSRDPVNLSTGNFVYDHEDFRIGGGIPLSFRRYYNSRTRSKGCLGRCFVHNYEVHLEEKAEKGKVTVTMGDGQKKTFRKEEDGTCRSLYSAVETLVAEEETYVLTTPAGERTVFRKEGQMIRQENRQGRGITFSYGEEGRLEKAGTDNGAFLEYTYDSDGQLVQVEDHTGRKVELSYEKGKISAVKTPGGSVYAYRYGKNGRIEETVNPRGYVTVKNTYDEKRRITGQEFPDGGHMWYTYDDGKRQVILTERNGSKITYVHDSKYRNTDVLYEDGTKEHFGYNGKNQRTLYVDRNGNETRMAYDNRGNVTQIINALGDKISLTYDAENHPLRIKINGKEKQKNCFDGKGHLLETADALGRKTTFTYNSAGLPEAMTAPDGSTVRLAYDGKGNIIRITDEAGGETGYAYDGLNRVVQVTDPNGNQTKLTYDEADNVLTLTNAAGDVRRFAYNESGKVTKITDFDGGVVKRTYNALNRPEEITDQLGRVTKLSYDAMWNISRVTLPDGAVTAYCYDGNNRLESVEDAAGNTVSYRYDGAGNRVSEKDQLGNAVRFSYDAVGRLILVQGEEGLKMSYAYDAEGHVTEAEDALGNRVFLEYDEAGQLVRERDTAGACRSYTYTPLGKTGSVTDEAGRKVQYTYLPGGRLSAVRRSDGTEESYTYDAAGNVKTHTDRNGFVTSYEYDCLGRITRISGSGGERKEYAYDAAGNVTKVTDAYGHATCYEYSLTGQLTKVTDALGNETEYLYDPCDRLTEIRQYGEETGKDKDLLRAEERNRESRVCHVTRYERNLLGQVETITDALGQTERYTYDAKGQLIEKLDKEGYLTKYGYTAQGDVNRIAYADGREVKLSYNPLRQLEEMEDWLGITRIEKDAAGRALKVQYSDGKEVSYTYGKSGERTGVTYPDGKRAEYLYDEELRLSGLRDGSGTITYSYDEKGRLSRKSFPNGMETTYAYNGAGLLSELLHRDKEGILDRYRYQYDLTGNKTAIEKQRRGLPEESGVYAYRYDALGRLNSVARDGQSLRTYEYDAFGNRSLLKEGSRETSYVYNVLNQLVSRADAMQEETYIYDKRGNLSFIKADGALKNRYTYGAINRLEQAENGEGEAASYTYNGLGHRVGKTAGPETKIQYTIDLTKSYHNLLQKEERGDVQTYLWDGGIAGIAGDGGRSGRYYLKDELGSPIRLISESGELAETYGYDEFGQDLYGNQGVTQPFGYTGYQADRTAGTYYAQAREYRAELGRFGAVDTIKGAATAPYTLNEYGYCWNNPMNLADRDGAWPQWIEDAGETIKNEWDSLHSNAVRIWEEDICGVDTVIYEKGIGDYTFSIKDHEGGNVIVCERKLVEKDIMDLEDIIPSWSINVGLKIPGTSASWEQSLSGDSLDITSWKYTNTMSISDERTDIYAESGISIDKKGLNIRGGVGGTNNISNLLPEKMNLESFSNLSWSLAGEINVLNWDQIVELALCVVAVSALVVVGVVLVADDVSLVGVLNDGLLLPLGLLIEEKIDTIVQIVNDIALNISKCM